MKYERLITNVGYFVEMCKEYATNTIQKTILINK